MERRPTACGLRDSSSVQTYLRTSARTWRECHQFGPFLATFSRASRNPFLNYAIPDSGAVPSDHDVRALMTAYRDRGLPPRLEYIPDLAPDVEPALLDAGFSAEGRLALMGFPDGTDVDVSLPPGIELVEPTTDDDLLAVRFVQHEAYAEPEPPGPREAESLRRGLDAGAVAVLARTIDGGTPVGAGEYTTPMDGVTAITSIAVVSSFRRRGVARAITAWLIRIALHAACVTHF